jgi:putative oxidoreductase
MKSDEILRDLALLAVRGGLGGSIAAHGAQKMFGAFDGPGLSGASKMMGSLGFDPPDAYAKAASAAELAAGLLMLFGALGPVGPAMLTSTMVVAIETVHRKNGYFMAKNGFELNAMYLMLALLLATEGYGSISVDSLAGLDDRMGPALGWIAFAGGVATGLAILSGRAKPQPEKKTIHVETGTTEPVNTGP